MDFDIVVKKRASIKKFSSKKPPIEKITEIIQTANLAPSPGNLHILRYVIVETSETISKIADACQQTFISKAPCVVVICSDSKQIDNAYEEKSKKYLKHHVGAAVENFLLKVTNENMAACWVGAFAEPIIRNILKIPDSFEIEVVIPVGYEQVKGNVKQRAKPSLVTRVFFESWGNRFYKPISKIRRSDV